MTDHILEAATDWVSNLSKSTAGALFNESINFAMARANNAEGLYEQAAVAEDSGDIASATNFLMSCGQQHLESSDYFIRASSYNTLARQEYLEAAKVQQAKAQQAFELVHALNGTPAESFTDAGVPGASVGALGAYPIETMNNPMARFHAPNVPAMYKSLTGVAEIGEDGVEIWNFGIAKGDVPGHPFHGNQYGMGQGSSHEIEGNNLAEKAANLDEDNRNGNPNYESPGSAHRAIANDHFAKAAELSAKGDTDGATAHTMAGMAHEKAAKLAEKFEDAQVGNNDGRVSDGDADKARDKWLDASARAANQSSAAERSHPTGNAPILAPESPESKAATKAKMANEAIKNPEDMDDILRGRSMHDDAALMHDDIVHDILTPPNVGEAHRIAAEANTKAANISLSGEGAPSKLDAASDAAAKASEDALAASRRSFSIVGAKDITSDENASNISAALHEHLVPGSGHIDDTRPRTIDDYHNGIFQHAELSKYYAKQAAQSEPDSAKQKEYRAASDAHTAASEVCHTAFDHMRDGSFVQPYANAVARTTSAADNASFGITASNRLGGANSQAAPTGGSSVKFGALSLDTAPNRSYGNVTIDPSKLESAGVDGDGLAEKAANLDKDSRSGGENGDYIPDVEHANIANDHHDIANALRANAAELPMVGPGHTVALKVALGHAADAHEAAARAHEVAALAATKAIESSTRNADGRVSDAKADRDHNAWMKASDAAAKASAEAERLAGTDSESVSRGGQEMNGKPNAVYPLAEMSTFDDDSNPE